MNTGMWTFVLTGSMNVTVGERYDKRKRAEAEFRVNSCC